MSNFCLLRDPSKYVADEGDLSADKAARGHWLDLFEGHFEVMLTHAVTQYGRKATKQIAAAREQFGEALVRLRADPASLPGGKCNVIALVRFRDEVLRSNGLADPFKHVKDRENASAAELYPTVVRKLHVMSGADRWLHLVKCVFAGNVFDLGAKATLHLATAPTDFLAAVENGKPRPWLVDDYDALAEDLAGAPPTKWGKAVVFVDNAGSDLVLGVMPLARELALAGTKIVLAANERPSLNDVTADETVTVVEDLAAADEDLATLITAGMFEVVSSGSGGTLIDFSDVSDELNEAAADADLVVIVGMGRAVQSNWDADFTVDALSLALLKDEDVAKSVGGELFDCICKYRRAGD